MKRTSQHAFEPEEVMAYLDGELPAQEAAALASHLEHCGECQAVAAQMRQVSERMLDFQIEPCSAKVSDAVLKAFDEAPSEPASKVILGWKPPRRRRMLRVLAWAGGAVAAVVVLGIFLLPKEKRVPVELESSGRTVETWEAPQATPNVPRSPVAMAQGIVGGVPAAAGNAGVMVPSSNMNAVTRRGLGTFSAGANQVATVQEPMIVQTASITILASNYDQASKAIEQITKQHGGYVQELNASTATGAARSLSATVRVPEKQLDPCLADLRKLGHVEQESRSNQEITDEYIDLTARLRNARAEEQRIVELLQTRTGKLSDVLEAERELARVRGEIESMDGQRAYMEHEVSYATVQVELNEEYRAQLNPEAFSTGTRIRNSLVEGLRNLGDGVVALVIFALAYGPSILFWLALLGATGWFVWTRFRRGRTRA